ncbi:Hypothetical predicted protein [Paramuricea clavata]|uniref:Uncharacterized protein n=1 Tax=Paramuricea clavata TaxID=317549 RepID=A0A7D9L5Y5_PARCT|nr:Hypothetical predicted protein [Paramuricea clavata]
MGKEKQKRRSRHKVLCIPCDKSMNWEFFRNSHIHNRHGGKSVPIKVIGENQSDKNSDASKFSDVRRFFEPKTATTCKETGVLDTNESVYPNQMDIVKDVEGTNNEIDPVDAGIDIIKSTESSIKESIAESDEFSSEEDIETGDRTRNRFPEEPTDMQVTNDMINTDVNTIMSDESMTEECQFQTTKKHSPETLLCLAGNLEFVASKVATLSSRLRDSRYIDIDAILNEIIFTSKNISDAVEKITETAQEYLQERCDESNHTDDNKCRLRSSPQTRRPF